MSSKTKPLKDLDVYKDAHVIGKEVWDIVECWSFYNKDTLGKKFIRAADSISLNISEGYGRFYFKENKMFCYYSRGSLYETAECLIKAKERKLVDELTYKRLAMMISNLRFRLNNYIASIGTQKQS